MLGSMWCKTSIRVVMLAVYVLTLHNVSELVQTDWAEDDVRVYHFLFNSDKERLCDQLK